MEDKLHGDFVIPNTYDIPIHDQKDKMNCTAHAIATSCEYSLSSILNEQVIVDVDDLWEKQLKYGTADERFGDTFEGALKVASEHGILFETKSGKRGIFKPGKGIEFFKVYKEL